MSKEVVFFELDLPKCSLTYGVAPCTASIPTTGADKCYNCKATCQDLDNIDLQPVTLRFAYDTAYLPSDISNLPIISDWTVTPARVALGEDIGERGKLEVKFKEAPHPDTGPGYDKYADERSYNPFTQGHHWAKFRARHPALYGLDCRLIVGTADQPLANMETRHFKTESFNGSDEKGNVSIIALDPLKAISAARAQLPAASRGRLQDALDDSDTSITLVPTGIGDEEYDASGWVRIGSEVCAFTRSGDDLTLDRGEHNTEAAAHDSGDSVQQVLRFNGVDPAQIASDLLSPFVDPDLITLADWLAQTSYLGVVYSRWITSPTAVEDLLSDLIVQGALVFYYDDLGNKIRLSVLQPVPVNADVYDDSVYLTGSFGIAEQPDKRLSEIWTEFGQIDPTDETDQPKNFRTIAATVNLENEADYGSAAIKKIKGTWIAEGGLSVAARLNDILLDRFGVPPRKFEFALLRSGGNIPTLGQGIRLGHWTLQDASGAAVTVPAIVTSLKPSKAIVVVQAEEASLTPIDAAPLTLTFSSSQNNVNAARLYEQVFSPAISGDIVTITIEAGVIIGSDDVGRSAFDMGDWADGVVINFYHRGRIEGRAGKGGKGGSIGHDGEDGQDGGTALYLRAPVNIFYEGDAGIWAGGGGGGGGGGGQDSGLPINQTGRGGGGGGGGGRIAGAAGTGSTGTRPGKDGEDGTATAGGDGGKGGQGQSGQPDGGRGGQGGNPGMGGDNGHDGGGDIAGDGGDGGAAGRAIDGSDFISSETGSGDIRGDTVSS